MTAPDPIRVTDRTFALGPWHRDPEFARRDVAPPHARPWETWESRPTLDVIYGDRQRTVPIAVTDCCGCWAVVRAALPSPVPLDADRLARALVALPRLRLSGEQLNDIDPDPESHFIVDWDEYDEFVRLDDVRRLASPTGEPETPETGS